MNGPLFVAILAPLGAAAMLLSFRDRWIAQVGLFGALAGTATLLARGVSHGAESIHGFSSDPWRAGLATASAAVAFFMLTDRRDEPYTEALFMATLASVIACVFAGGTFVFAAFLVASTIGFGATAWVCDSRAGARAFGWFALSDLLAALGLVFASHASVGVPPRAHGVAAALLTAAVLARIIPSATARERSSVSALAFGPMRVQAFAMAAWIASGGSAHALAIAGAVVAAWFARRAARDSDAGAALCANAALALSAFGLRTPSSLRAAVVLAAGTFIGAAFAVSGGEDVGASSIGAAPLGATVVGGALVMQAAFGRALEHRIDFIVAAGALLAFGWLAIAGVAGVRASGRRMHARWLIAPALGAGAFAFVPDRVARALTSYTASGIRAPIALLHDVTPVSAWLGISFAIAGGAALLLAGKDIAIRRQPEIDGFTVRAETIRVRASSIVVAASVATVAVLFVISARRGFL